MPTTSTPLFPRLTLFLGLLFTCFLSFGQDAPVKYGKVSDEEIKLKVYDKDTSAAAVILADYGQSYFTVRNGLQLVFERTMRIKILKKGGYDWANVEVPYFVKNSSNKEYVSAIKATTYNWEGGKAVKVKMDDKAIFDEKQSDNWYVKKFTLPAVKEGSILDITYSVTSDFFFNYQDWTFQHTIPVVHSEYRASFPEYFDYKHYMQGYEPMVVNESRAGTMNIASGGNMSSVSTQDYRWVMKDVPALTSEAYITTLRDYLAKIEFELEWVRIPGQLHERVSGTWESFTKDLMADEQFGVQFNRTGFFKNEVANFITIKDTLARANAVYTFVKDNVKWNGNYGVTTTGNLRKIFENKTGSAADINLLLVSLMRDAGIDAHPVVLSTREHGRVPQHSPLMNKFNYTVGYVTIGGRGLFLDGTDPVQPLGLLPTRCLNGNGWLVSKEGGAWVPLQSRDRSVDFLSADLQLAPSGVLTGKVKESAGGHYGVGLRKSINEQGETKYLEKFASIQDKLERKKPTLQNLKEVQSPINLEYEVVSEGDAQAKDIIYLNPMLLKS
ncbi:MAG: DUF3857 and transglutaminase domain-containing protein, partial [Rufibacter sp.]